MTGMDPTEQPLGPAVWGLAVAEVSQPLFPLAAPQGQLPSLAPQHRIEPNASLTVSSKLHLISFAQENCAAVPNSFYSNRPW